MLDADVDLGKKISKASVGLLLRHPFFGSLLYRHEVLITASVETAAVTTDRVILLNPEFVEKCSAPQLEFLLAHEVMHIVFAHIARRGDRDPVIYNIACDAVINETLIAEGVGEFIAGGIRMLGAQYRTSESIYDEIASRLKPKEKTSPAIGQGPTLPLFPDDLEADGQAGGLAGASDDGSENGNDSTASTPPFIGELNIPDLPREARKMTQEEINEQIEEGKLALGQALTTARTCGNMSGGLARFIGSILESSMPWYELLERYMVGKAEQRYNWSRPDKRRLNIAYLPRRERFPSLGTVVIGVDVSGPFPTSKSPSISAIASEFSISATRARSLSSIAQRKLKPSTSMKRENRSNLAKTFGAAAPVCRPSWIGLQRTTSKPTSASRLPTAIRPIQPKNRSPARLSGC